MMYVRKNDYGDIAYILSKSEIQIINSGDSYKYCADLEYMPYDAILDWDNNKITTSDEVEHTLDACTVITLTANITGSTLTITRSAACKLYVCGLADITVWGASGNSFTYTLLLETSESSSDAVITLDIPWRNIRVLRLEQTNTLISNTVYISGGPSNAYYLPLAYSTFSYMNDAQLALRPYRIGQLAFHAANNKLYMSLSVGSSADWLDITKISNNVDYVLGTSAPSSAPEKIGQIFIDANSELVYISKGTSNSGDWICLNPSV